MLCCSRLSLHLIDYGENIRRQLLDAIKFLIWLHLFILVGRGHVLPD